MMSNWKQRSRRKTLQILTSKTDEKLVFKNESFNGRVDSESLNIYNDIKEENKKNYYRKRVCIRLGRRHHYNFTIFLGLANFAEDIYSSNFSFEAARMKQRNMEDMIETLNNYNLNSKKYKIQKINTLLNAREFYKGIQIHFGFQSQKDMQ